MPTVFTIETKCYRCGDVEHRQSETESAAREIVAAFAKLHRDRCGASASIGSAVGTMTYLDRGKLDLGLPE